MIEPKYDLSIAMPICDATKAFYKRYEDHKKYGLLNIKDRKIQLKLLIGPGEDFYGHDIKAGWPSGIDVVVVETPYCDVARKIAWFFDTNPDEEIMEARWHAKWDDDSLNDIDTLIRWLDEDYDWTRAEYLAGDVHYDLDDNTMKSLRKVGYDHLRYHERLVHELEVSVCSQAAMMTVRRNEKAKEYLTERLKYFGGFGDHALCIMMYFCKIHPVRASFLSFWNELPKFSFFGGKFAHVHMHQEDQTEPRTFAVAKAIIDGVKNKGLARAADNRFFFARGTGDSRDYIGELLFSAEHRMIDFNHMAAGLWGPSRQGDGIVVVFQSSPWLAFDLEPSEDGGFQGICPDTRLPLKMDFVGPK
jgi:hypothetical protein